MNDDTGAVSITEAAKHLGVSVRTVQRRLDSGELEAVTEGDRRRVRLPDGTPASATGDTTARHDTGVGDATLTSDLNESSRQNAKGDATEGDNLHAPHSSYDAPTQAAKGDSDATRELIEQLKGERDRLVEQLERAQDDAAQWRAMAAQLISNRALPQSTLGEAVEGDLSAPNVRRAQVPAVVEKGPEMAATVLGPGVQVERTKGFRAFVLRLLRG